MAMLDVSDRRYARPGSVWVLAGGPFGPFSLVLVVLLLCGPAHARPRETVGHDTGIWFDARTDFTNAYEDLEGLAVLPGLAVGYAFGPFVVACGLDATYWHKTRETGSNSHVELDKFHLAIGPEVEYEVGRVDWLSFFVAAAMRFRYYWAFRKEVIDTVSRSQPRVKTIGFDTVLGVGSRYFLGHRIGLGLEVGLVLAYAKSRTSEQLRNLHKMFNMGPFGRVTVTFVW